MARRPKHWPRYYTEKGANAFWAPGKFAHQFGLPKSRALGPAGPEAMKAAIDLTSRLDRARAAARAPAAPAPSPYPAGSLGRFYERFQKTEAWRVMKPRTREDYVRAWPRIEARFGEMLISSITPDMSERFHTALHPAHNPASLVSANEAHRTLKVWRALLSALEAYELRKKAPIGRVSNPQPKGRSALWLHDEAMMLAFGAVVLGYAGLAVALRAAWDAMLAPVDARTLTLASWRPDALEIATRRGKTGRVVFAAVTPETGALIDAYLETLPALMPDAPIIRRPDGTAYRSKDTFGDDFRAVREIVFPGDERQFLDLRRSAATEARLGGADKDDLGKAMANRIDENTGLEETYILAASRKVLEARKVGRARLAARA